MKIDIFDTKNNIQIPMISHNRKVYVPCMSGQTFMVVVHVNDKIPNDKIASVQLYINNTYVSGVFIKPTNKKRYIFQGWPTSSDFNEFEAFKFESRKYEVDNDRDSSSASSSALVSTYGGSSSSSNVTLSTIRVELSFGSQIPCPIQSTTYFSYTEEKYHKNPDTKPFKLPTLDTGRGELFKPRKYTGVADYSIRVDSSIPKRIYTIYYDTIDYLQVNGISINPSILKKYLDKVSPPVNLSRSLKRSNAELSSSSGSASESGSASASASASASSSATGGVKIKEEVFSSKKRFKKDDNVLDLT